MKHGSHLVETSLMGHIREELGLPCAKGQVASMAWKAAIDAKHGFSGNEDMIVYLPLSQQYKTRWKYNPSEQFDEQTNQFTLTRASLVKAFDPIVRPILKAILRHISVWNVTNIVLVGGFSQSVYLRNEIERRLQDIDEEERPSLRHLQGSDA